MAKRPGTDKASDQYSEGETQRRFEQALKGATQVPPAKKKSPKAGDKAK